MSESIIHVGDCLTILRTMPESSIHCVVTSPPYYMLRAYGTNPQVWGGDPKCEHRWQEYISPGQSGGVNSFQTQNAGSLHSGGACGACGAWRGELGAEPTPEMFIEHMTWIFREVRRVLREDGTCWMNMGDSYAGHNLPGWRPGNENKNEGNSNKNGVGYVDGCKPKDLIGVPWLLAFALRADGWYLRSDIIWHKPNPMPESVTDRPTKSHEYLFLLTKSARYFYDAEAIKEKAVCVKMPGRNMTDTRENYGAGNGGNGGLLDLRNRLRDSGEPDSTRNKRSVWTISTQSFSEAHFATYPLALVMPCIKAGTSEKGCCPTCGAPWERIVESNRFATRPGADTKITGGTMTDGNRDAQRHVTETRTMGWRPTCDCAAADPVPCKVMDIFTGSGTSGVAALQLGRDFVGCELNPEYREMAMRRIARETKPNTFRTDLVDEDAGLFTPTE